GSRRPSGESWRRRRTIRGSAAAAALPDGCSLRPPAASNSRRASRAPHLVGRRCACRSRSPARSPRSPCYPDSLLEVDGELGGVEDAAQVEQEAAVVDAAEDGRARGAEARGDALGAHLRVLDRERAAREREGGHGAAPDLALGRHERDAVALAEPGRPPRSARAPPARAGARTPRARPARRSPDPP